MGCSGSASDSKVKAYEDRLYAVCQKFDFNIHSEQNLSFNDLFSRENCNELGQNFSPEATTVLIAEFRKFLYLTAAEISRVRRSKEGQAGLKPALFNDGQKFWGYETPLNAAPYIDRVWRALISYDKQYRVICAMIAQGYIFRKEPRLNPRLALERYNLARNQLYADKDKLNPFHNVWPAYRDQDEFYNDFIFTVQATPS